MEWNPRAESVMQSQRAVKAWRWDSSERLRGQTLVPASLTVTALPSVVGTVWGVLDFVGKETS